MWALHISSHQSCICTAHPSSFDTGRAWKPNGLSLRHCLRSSARRPLATPDMPALLVDWAHLQLCSPCTSDSPVVLCLAQIS